MKIYRYVYTLVSVLFVGFPIALALHISGWGGFIFGVGLGGLAITLSNIATKVEEEKK